ncbi:glutamate receptor [Klebsormidium nitens]|uniref:Glutamate receptor n=1 Tax=Klebsormidium nitens TaxID=105231 RepID=A0A1Y1ICK6_KLENI|nr:glutamate receptor [Klebsormidium nitens]|eukprot:GAQ88650.1 glutamate receptor [Klebsormidium nitens]
MANLASLTQINVVVAERPPYAYPNASDPYGWSGMLVSLIPVLFQAAGINASLNFYESPDNGGGTLKNGTWNGVTGELIAKRADIAAFPLVQSPGRPDYIDMSYSYNEAGLGILVKKQISSSSGTTLYLKPFTSDLWAVLICTVLGMGFALYLLSLVSPLGGYAIKRMRNVTAGTEEQRYVIEDMLDSFLIDVLMAAVNNAWEPRGKSWSIRLPFVAYIFFMLIIISSYTANFASYLTVNQFSTVVSSLQDLKKGGLNFTINAGGATYTYFTQSLAPTILTLQPKLSTVDATFPGLDSVRSGAASAYIGESPTLRYFAGMEPCDLAVVGQPFGPSVYTLGLQFNSPYTPRINEAMLTLKGNGYLDRLQRIWIQDANVCGGNSASDTIGALSISDFSGLWYLLLVAIAFGFVWAGLERYVLFLLTRYPSLRDRLAAWKAAAARHGKNFEMTRVFSHVFSRSVSILVRSKSEIAAATPTGRARAPASAEEERSTERAARLAVENYDREKAERAAQKVGRLW